MRNCMDTRNTRETDYLDAVEVYINVPSRSHKSVEEILAEREQEEQADARYEELNAVYYDGLMEELTKTVRQIDA